MSPREDEVSFGIEIVGACWILPGMFIFCFIQKSIDNRKSELLTTNYVIFQLMLFK